MGKKRIWSLRSELLSKSKESAIAAVQIFNNPSSRFKSETFIVLMNIAWTYLMHAYYKMNRIDYRYYTMQGIRKKFTKTKYKAFKHWELERCLDYDQSPIDKNTSNNLKFLIGLRHEIEHQMTTSIDDLLSARFQACCLNYNYYFKKLFNDQDGIEKSLSFSLQFSSISSEQKAFLEEYEDLPANIRSFIMTFDINLTTDEYNSQQYAYRLLFVPKSVNHIGQADKVIEFVKSDSPLAAGLNHQYTLIKETEKRKYLPGQIVNLMKQEGYINFNMRSHIKLFQNLDAKNTSKNFGAEVAKQWYWGSIPKPQLFLKLHCNHCYT